MGQNLSREAAFLNRQEELAILRSFAPPACSESSVLFLRGPSGYGKSALTTRLLRWLQINHDMNVAIVDPSIRLKSGGARIHDGYFIQRLAEDLSFRAAGRYGSLQQYLTERRWQRAAQKPLSDFGRKFFSIGSIYEETLDYVKRFLSRGEYTASNLLRSDKLAAVNVCADYAESVCRRGPIFIVVREAQHIDHQSLRFMLRLNRIAQWQHLFIEYTSDTSDFQPDHDKIIHLELDGYDNWKIVELDRLGRDDFERLVQRASVDRIVTTDEYQRWSGNIRFIDQIQRSTSVQHNAQGGARLPLSLTEYVGELNKHLLELTRQEQLLLAIVTAHVEPIARNTALSIASAIDRYVPASTWAHALSALQTSHRFIEQSHGGLHLENEDIAAAIEASVEMRGLLGVARHALRDFYVDAIRLHDYRLAPMPIAVRQVLILCAKTRDTTILLNVLERLTEEIAGANDQSIYVDAVIGAVSDNDGLFMAEFQELIDWASGLAYETSDFNRTIGVLALLPELDTSQSVMLACSKVEVGKQQEALHLLDLNRAKPTGIDASLALDLVELFAHKDLGNNDRARELLQAILTTERYKSSALYGYALRFTEAIIPFPECTQPVLQSVDWFARFQLVQSHAYSAFAAAMHLARQGETESARRLVEVGAHELEGHVRDQHLILNNRALITMLSENPDFCTARDLLLTALRSSRDDFSDVVVLNNLAIAHCELGEHVQAVECVGRMLRSLSTPTLDPDLQWGPGFTAMTVFERAGLHQRAEEMRVLPPRAAGGDADYWEYRYGVGPRPRPGRYDYLLRFDYHPLFLSHWLIDLEGIKLLREVSPR